MAVDRNKDVVRGFITEVLSAGQLARIDEFLAPTGYDTTIDPSIVAEFAHTVYRFGHSMLTETVDRYDADFNVIGADPNNPDQQMGLIAAFLNPLAFAASGPTPEEAAGAIVRGLTRQLGNEIDEFVTEALRNNLLGLPLDLPAINIARGRDAGIPSLNQARREFFEETGVEATGPFLELGSVRLKSGKVIHAWAWEGDADAAAIRSNEARLEWPRGSGRWITYPEVDSCGWFASAEARKLLNPSQAGLIERLERLLRDRERAS